MSKAEQLEAYRTAVRQCFKTYLDWTKYRTIPKTEPQADEFILDADATEEEIKRARILGIADAIQTTDPLNIALQLFSKPEDFVNTTWIDLLIDESIYDGS